MYFVDTNVFLRFLSRDDEEKATRCQELFVKASLGEISLYTSELVVAELVWVLQSPKNYGLKPAKIRDILLPLLTQQHINLPNKKLYPLILELFATRDIDYIDAYHAVMMEHKNVSIIFSYDRHFDSLQGLQRLEP
jgi:uncharacterized protein